jgi:hypothetical protein
MTAFYGRSVCGIFGLSLPQEARSIGANPNASFIASGLNNDFFRNDYTGDVIRSGKGRTHGYLSKCRVDLFVWKRNQGSWLNR